MKCNWLETTLLFTVAFLMIKPGVFTDVPGFVLFGLVFFLQKTKKNKIGTPEATVKELSRLDN